MTFDELTEKNRLRCEQDFQHPLDAWKSSEWTNAMAGEIGETCNLAKKLDRLTLGSARMNNKPGDQDPEDLIRRMLSEAADAVIYADLLCSKHGRKLGDVVRETFNAKSDELGCAIKLEAL